jgi:hypothetical protein
MSDLTFGERAVGLKFNPSQNDDVEALKKRFAAAIDIVFDIKPTDGLHKEILSEAIKQAMTAQMWAVKAATWGIK